MTNPIPAGYHSVTPALVVKDAKEALGFYKKAFGAVERIVIPSPEGKVMHAEIQIGDSILMLGEEDPKFPTHKSPESLHGSPVSLNIYLPDADAAYKKAVDAGAKGTQPPKDAFWGDRYGMVEDPFGYSWGLLTHKKDMSTDEMKKAAQDFFAKAPRQ